MSKYNVSQTNAMDQDCSNMAAGIGGSPKLGAALNSIWAALSAAANGITAAANDVDSLALGGGQFSVDQVNTNGLYGNANGFVFAWLAGRVLKGQTVVAISAGNLTMAAASTNYVEADGNGTVYSNTAGFTAGRCQLYQVITSGSTITSVVNVKDFLCAPANGSITGAMLSSSGATKTIEIQLQNVSATTLAMFQAPATGAISKVTVISDTAVTASDTNYWSFTCINKGAAGSGSQAIIQAAAANTTKATGGASLAAFVADNMTLTTLSIGTELNVTAGDVVVLPITKTAAATTMVNLTIRIDFTFAG